MIKAIIFDFDGVLAFTIPFHYAAWQRVLQPRGLVADEQVMRLHEGSPAFRIVQAMARRHGVELDDETAKQYMAERNEIFLRTCDSKPYPEIAAILDFCDRHQLVRAVATGTTLANVQHVIDPALLQRFQVVIKQGDYTRGKPWPDPFLVAAERLGVAPDSCVVVENAPFGIEAAKSAGMFCIALTTTLAREHLLQADVIVESHADLLKYLETMVL